MSSSDSEGFVVYLKLLSVELLESLRGDVCCDMFTLCLL
jgi:hypothetical protein